MAPLEPDTFSQRLFMENTAKELQFDNLPASPARSYGEQGR